MEHGRRDGRHRKHSSRKQEKKAQDDDNSSLSSLGSLPEATSVVLQFNDDLPSQRRLTTHLGNTSSHTSSHSQSHQTHSQTFSRLKESRSRLTSSSSSSQHASSSSSKICPHCKKSFANAFAVPKHIAQVHNRAGELHCSKCTYKNRSKHLLEQHERTEHRTCPYCRKVFVLLERHMQHCTRRR